MKKLSIINSSSSKVTSYIHIFIYFNNIHNTLYTTLLEKSDLDTFVFELADFLCIVFFLRNGRGKEEGTCLTLVSPQPGEDHNHPAVLSSSQAFSPIGRLVRLILKKIHVAVVPLFFFLQTIYSLAPLSMLIMRREWGVEGWGWVVCSVWVVWLGSVMINDRTVLIPW